MRVFISTSFALLWCLYCSYAQTRTIVINEFLYDPLPSAGLPEAEYVEILNVSPHAIQADGWILNARSIPAFTLFPGQFLILCKASDADLFTTGINVIKMESWDILNNSGQSIVLQDNLLNILDSLQYDSHWIGDPTKSAGGWSLERINPVRPCSGRDNWRVSENLHGGTPGFTNSVFNDSADEIPPAILSTEWLNPRCLQLNFSEILDFADTETREAFRIPGHNILEDIEIRGFARYQILNFTETLDTGTPYLLEVKNLIDCSGNMIRDTVVQIGRGAAPHFIDILITELMVDETPAVGLPESEYIEIYNASDKLVSLGNCFILSDSIIYPLPEHNILPDSYYFLVPDSRADLFSGYSNCLIMERFPRLHNAGKALGLYNRDNGLIFPLKYDKGWYKYAYKSGGGYSLEMIDVRNPCGDAGNWTASESESGGTPGHINSVYQDNPDLTRPAVSMAHALDAGSIKVHFNEKLHMDSFEKMSVLLNDSDMHGLWKYDTFNLNSLSIMIPEGFAAGSSYGLELNNVWDCAGNYMDPQTNSIAVQVPDFPEPGEVVINEIMFDPMPGGTRWIELYNRSHKVFNMKGWYLSDQAGLSGEEHFPIAGMHRLLDPFSFVVLTEDVDKVILHFPDADDKKCLEIPGMPPMADRQGFVAVSDPDGTVLDDLYYHKEMHNLFVSNPEGVSLERISPDVPSGDPDNWESASSSSGYGTPTQVNSQFLGSSSASAQISVSPEIVSPDGDGIDDLLNIQMVLQTPGYAANLFIFNIRGVLIKALTENRLLGTAENIIWDGTMDSGDAAPPGHYILLLEMVHPKGNREKYKKNFVIAGNQ